MFRNLAATLTIVLCVATALVAVNPVQGHFTLGLLTGNYRFHTLDFDPHVSGVIGYVWPGGGENAYVGFPNLASSVLSPGYQSPLPCRLNGELVGNGAHAGVNIGGTGEQIPGNQCNPPGAPTTSWYGLQGSAYAPFGAVLAGSTGDLIFALNSTAGSVPGGTVPGGSICTWSPPVASTGECAGWSGVTIFLPPGFTLPTMDGSDVVTTVTNSYANIQVYKVSPYDRYAPGWTAVNIWTDGGESAAANGASGTSPTSITYYNHQFINFTSVGEWYYFRINGVTAPDVAGRYFFKILLSGDSSYLAGPEGTASNSTAAIHSACGPISCHTGEAPTQFIPTQNWPVLLVKGEIDPAIMTGTIRYGGYNSTLYGQPIGEAGRVWAHMEDKIDPYTGQQITMCPAVGQPMVPGCTDAVGYWNATANGHYEVEGVASGVYTIYDEAAGFPTEVMASHVTVLKGQSLHFDGYLQPGPVIHGNVFTKHQFGNEPWPCEAFGGFVGILSQANACGPNGSTSKGDYIKIELYDAPTLGNIPDPSANLVSWSPLPCVAGGQNLFFPKGHAGECGDPRFAAQLAFPWHEYVPNEGYGVDFGRAAPPCGGPITCPVYYQVSAGVGSDNTFQSPLNNGVTISQKTQDPQGVGPPQNWFVQGGTTTPFHFEFGVKGEYGAPRDLDGQVPQVYATWVNGLTPGRYYARAWVFRYVQTALDGATLQEYYFDITPEEWAGDVTLPIDLRLSSWVNKTVHFHNQLDSLIEDPIDTGAGFMSGYLMGADGNIYSYNQTALGLTCLNRLSPTIKCDANNVNSPFTPNILPAGIYYASPGGDGWNVGLQGRCFNMCTPVPFVFPGPGPTYGGYTGSPPGFGNSPNSGVDLDPSGINRNAIQVGRANIQFWGINDTWSGENYGIPAGIYTPNTYVLGYLPRSLEQVAISLSGTMTSVSDHMVRGPGFNVTLYSVDWERPTVNRPWEFGNLEGWNPLAGFFSSQISSKSLTGYINSNNVGLSIGLGAYLNGSLADWTGDEEATALGSSIGTSNLYQNMFENNVTVNGGGFAVTSLTGVLQDANSSWFGSELKQVGNAGGNLGPSTASGGQPFLAAGSFHNLINLFLWPHVLEPTAFESGQYNFTAFTYGYVQDQVFSVYVDRTQVADVRLNLVIGVNVTLDILFKKESIITGMPDNMSARIRIFNDQGELVGEWMSSNGVYVGNQAGHVRAADGTVGFPFGPLHAVIPGRSIQNNEYNYVPAGTNLLHVQIGGLPQVPAWGYDAPAGFPGGLYSGDPVFTPYACDFELVCYADGYRPSGRLGPGMQILGPALEYPFQNTGITGFPDYQGGWTAEADFVPWYANNSATPQAMSDGSQTTSGPFGSHIFAQYYTPVNGLLLGESYHMIAGTTASSGLSLTEDAALSSTFLGHSMVLNHIGPYSQEGVWQIAGTHLSGEASGIFAVDLNGFISGEALAFTWANDFRPISWATVSIVGANGATWSYYTYDGDYQMYLPSGTYLLTISSSGHVSQTMSLPVTDGESASNPNVYMQGSNLPVPEFRGVAAVAFAALAASVYLLRRRRK